MEKIAVTLEEAVEISGISRSSLYKAFAAGDIVPRKNGKRTLVLVADLKRYLEGLPVGFDSEGCRYVTWNTARGRDTALDNLTTGAGTIK